MAEDRPSFNSCHPSLHSAQQPEGSGHRHHTVYGGRPPHPIRSSYPYQRPGSNSTNQSNAVKDVKRNVGDNSSTHPLSQHEQQRLQQQLGGLSQQHASSSTSLVINIQLFLSL